MMEKDQIEKPEMMGVHTLSEFVFCPRAGVISHEQKSDDSGFDDGFVDLSYTPDYDIVLVRQEVTKILRRLESFSLGLLGATMATIIFGIALKPFLGFLCLLILVPTAAFLLPRLYKDLKRYRHLKQRLLLYAGESECFPDMENLKTELISWYSLLKSFDVEKCHELLIDEDLGIQGKPWKLMHHGKVCLPVFFCRKPASAGELENDPRSWLRKQHFVRMKAYCSLVEKKTGKHSSCGIIVFDGTMNAVAVKFWKNEPATKQLEEALMIARKTLKEFEKHDKVGVPSVNTCVRCHHGRPKLYRLEPGTARRDGTPVRSKLHKVVTGKKLQTYHSVCGDFFEWVPPHEKAADLNLASSDELEEAVEKEAQATT